MRAMPADPESITTIRHLSISGFSLSLGPRNDLEADVHRSFPQKQESRRGIKAGSPPLLGQADSRRCDRRREAITMVVSPERALYSALMPAFATTGAHLAISAAI
jgi:hypothetical protein